MRYAGAPSVLVMTCDGLSEGCEALQLMIIVLTIVINTSVKELMFSVQLVCLFITL